jgi:hypothetical protein
MRSEAHVSPVEEGPSTTTTSHADASWASRRRRRLAWERFAASLRSWVPCNHSSSCSGVQRLRGKISETIR